MPGPNATAFLSLALNAEAGAPDWIMLLPPGRSIPTVDARGPWLVDDASQVAKLSLQGVDRLAIDENHATDLAAPSGGPSPARGWIVELQARAEGVFGRVEWTETGKQLLADRAYRFISPVIIVDGKRVQRIARASLVNNPNLRGMAALNAQGDDMDLLKQLCEALGLPAESDAAAVVAKVKSMKGGAETNAAALAPIAKAAGLAETADATAVLNAVTTLATTAKAAPNAEAVTALQAELKTVTTALNSLQASGAKEKAVAFVDGAIKAGRVGVKPMRDHYIERHALNAAEAEKVEKEIGAMPILGPSGALTTPPAPDKDGKVALNADQANAAKLLGIPVEQYQKTLAAEAAQKEIA